MLLSGEWEQPYSREEAAFPIASLTQSKYWPPVRRIDGGYGDRNLVCACPPVEAYEADHDVLASTSATSRPH
jgi:glycine dehydrogenase